MEISCPQCSQTLRVADALEKKNPLLRCPTCRTTFRAGQHGGRAAHTPGKMLSDAQEGTSPRQFAPQLPSASGTTAAKMATSSPPPLAAPRSAPNADPSLRDFLSSQRSQPAETLRKKKEKSWSSGGWSWSAMVVVFILVKGGVRLAKQFQAQRKPQHVPVQIDQNHQQAIDRMMREAQQRPPIRPPAQDLPGVTAEAAGPAVPITLPQNP